MKKIKICLLTVFILFAAAFSGCAFGGIVTGEIYDDAESYSVGNFSCPAREVEKVSVHWRTGGVELVQTDGELLNVAESGRDLPDNKKLHWLLKDGLLCIRFWESGCSAVVNGADKRLTVEIPQGISVGIVSASASVRAGNITLNDFECVCTSGSATIGNLTCESAKLVSTSGRIAADGITAVEKIKVGSVSGKIEIGQIDAPSAELNSTSGSIEISIGSCRELDIGTVSGAVDIASGGMGAAITYASTSGVIKIAQEYTRNGEKYVVGDGACKISVRTTSGNLDIR